MSEFTTHIAAIGVGVVITLLLVGGFNNATNKGSSSGSSSSSPASSSKDSSSNANVAVAAKKKNKKKSKKKAAASVAVAVAVAPVPEPEPEPAPAPEPVKEAEAEAPKDQSQSNGKKKKTKKNKKNGASANANANSINIKNSNGNSTPAPAPTATAAAPKPKPAPPVAVVVPLQPRVVEEEAWATIPKKNKKNKAAAGLKKQQGAAAAAATAVDVKASDRVTIDAARVGIIIGPKGATMNAIQEKTGVKLDVNAPKLEDSSSNGGGGGSQFRPVVGGRNNKQTATVVITEGTSETRQLAKKAILELADRGYATLLQAEGFGESSVTVHPKFLSEIVGTGGKVIKAIQTGLEVKLTIPKTDWTPKTVQIGNIAPSTRIGIAGDSPQNVKTAKQVIRDLCNYHHHEITHPGFVHQEIYVPQEFFHCVIGTRGSEIKHIRGNYHVDVYMPSNSSMDENVICVGRSNDVEKAISYIKLLMDRDSELREQKYSDEGFGDDSHGW